MALKKVSLFFILLILLFTYSCENTKNKNRDHFDDVKPLSNNRFSFYEALSKNTEQIEVEYVEWAATDRPCFISTKNYQKNKLQDNLINYCFYLDTKDRLLRQLPKEIIQDLRTGKSVYFFGKYSKTKKFDQIFPNKVFELQRTSKTLSFEPENGYFKVFVYEKYQRIP